MSGLVSLHLVGTTVRGPFRFTAVAPPPDLTASRTVGTVALQPLIDLRTNPSDRATEGDVALTLLAKLTGCRVRPVTVTLGDRLPTTRVAGVFSEFLTDGGDLVLQLDPHVVAAWRDWARAAGWAVTE